MSQNLVFGPYFYENAKKNMLENIFLNLLSLKDFKEYIGMN